MSNDPSLPPDDSEVIAAEAVGDVVRLSVGFSLGIPHERARCEGVIIIPRMMLSRVVLALVRAADG